MLRLGAGHGSRPSQWEAPSRAMRDAPAFSRSAGAMSLAAFRDQADFFFFSSTSSNSASTTFSSGRPDAPPA